MPYVIFAEFLLWYNCQTVVISSLECVNEILNVCVRMSIQVPFKRDYILLEVEVLIASNSGVRARTPDYEIIQEPSSPLYLQRKSQTPLLGVSTCSAETWKPFNVISWNRRERREWILICIVTHIRVSSHMGPVWGRLLSALWCRCFVYEYEGMSTDV